MVRISSAWSRCVTARGGRRLALAAMAHGGWGLRVGLEDRVDTLLERMGFDLHDEARELADDLEGSRLAVTREGDTVFVYADTAAEAEHARRIVESVLDSEG